jgi:hypothetical protein
VAIDDLPERYEVLETVRSGKRRALVRAFDNQLERVMALKIVTLDGSLSRNQLVEESQMLLSLDSHPGLPTMRGDFFLDDAYVIVMDWIDGPDLATVLARRNAPGLTYATVVAYVSQAADALDHLHAHDPPIVHGDIKPGNLVVTTTGKVVLVDLGLAREAGSVNEAGTHGFMAPEVMAGEPCIPATDVYGLAATTVALLTGEPPGFGPPDFGDLDPAEAAPLRRALALGLATDPAERPATAGELAERIRAGHHALPSGVVTFLALEVLDDGRWDSAPEEMQAIADRMDDLVASLVERRAGRIVPSEATNHVRAVFSSGTSAVLTALDVQREVAEGALGRAPARVRGALHTGEAEARAGAYSGPVPVRVGRLRNHAPPGRTVVSAATAELVRAQLPEGVSLVELERDGTGAMIFCLLAPGDEPLTVDAAHVTPVVRVGMSTPPAPSLTPPEPAAPARDVPSPRAPAPAVPVGRVDERTRVEHALANARALAEQARRSGDDEGAARLDATAQQLAEQLASIDRKLRP